MRTLLFDIQRFSTHDGPGIRTVIFFKGCNLQCFWCHNPESIQIAQELLFNQNACINCGACVEACSNQVHVISADNHERIMKNCKQCFKCVNVCSYHALEISGYEIEIEDLVKEILKDKLFFEVSGGGVTLSGGEALIHVDYLQKLLMRLKEEQIHVILETNGTLNSSYYKKILDYIDIFYLDIKDTCSRRLKMNTNANLEDIYNTAYFLDEHKKNIVLVCLFINTINNTILHYDKIIQLYKSLKNVIGLKVLTYHDYGHAKLVKLGYKYETKENYHIDNEQASAIKKYFKENQIHLID